MTEQRVNHHEHEQIVVLADLSSHVEATLIVAKLKAAGIDASLSTDGGGSVAYPPGLIDGVRVLVFENDLAAARAIVDSTD